MYQIGERVEYLYRISQVGLTNLAFTVGKIYEVLDVDCTLLSLLIEDDVGIQQWIDEDYFKLALCGGMRTGDDVRLRFNAGGAILGVTLSTIYRVLDTDMIVEQVLILNDTGYTRWYDYQLFEIFGNVTVAKVAKKVDDDCVKSSYNGDSVSLKECGCDMVDLMRYGCKCGGI